MKFNTAVFYDIENLIGGYGARADYVSTFSLKDVSDEIRRVELVGGIAVQRAYANWSDPRLGVMRSDIVELGIEPVQMFGFGKGASKNASDIQLAIEAIDCAIMRPGLEVFVIVSGDGGFSCLAKKLHEYGRAVVGCAYRKATNKVFAAVCDSFIWIPDDANRDRAAANGNGGGYAAPDVTDPLLRDLVRRRKPCPEKERDAMEKAARAVLAEFASQPDVQAALRRCGVNISVPMQALKQLVPELSPLSFGFASSVELLRFLLRDTAFSLRFQAPSEHRMFRSDAPPAPGYEAMPPIRETRPVHSAVNYRELLSHGAPIIKLPAPGILRETLSAVHALPFPEAGMPLADILEYLDDVVDAELQDVKSAVLSLIFAGAFDRFPENTRLSEQRIRPAGRGQPGEMLERLRDHAAEKIRSLLGSVEMALLDELLS